VKAAVLIVMLAACVSPGLAAAQTASSCAACINAAECDTKRGSCVAECRARLFSIDPKRADCVTDCSSRAAQCNQATESSCRANNLCR
jgi:hypothetical protein